MTRRTVVVFDIDDTICKINRNYTEDLPKLYSECLQVVLNNDLYIFIPHFQWLLTYLLNYQCRIVFFSAGIVTRNQPLIEKLLSGYVLSREHYEFLIHQGQFQVYSRNHLIGGKKLLQQVLLPGETINDVILIDDLHAYAHGAFIRVPSSDWWKNHTYYILGYFMYYFGTAYQAHISIRDCVYSIPIREGTSLPDCLPLFTEIGFKTIKSLVPTALFYRNVCEGFNTGEFKI